MNTKVYAGVLLITALHAFDELVLIVALPTIAPELNAQGSYGLIIASYILASIVGMIWAGNSLDRYGPRPVLRIGVAIFLIGLLLAAGAWDGPSFVAGRILQGIGGGVGWTLTFGLISLMCDSEQQPRALAGMDIAWVVPSLMAPLAGGFLVDHFDWRWIFLIQAPLSLTALVLIDSRITELQGQGQSNNQSGTLAALCIAACTGIWLYAASHPIGVWTVAGLLALVLMFKPLQLLLPDRWWRLDTALSQSLVTVFIAFGAFYLTESFQPLYLIQVREFSSIEAGLVLSCASISWMVGAQAAARGWLATDYRTRLRQGFCLITIGIACLALVLFKNQGIMWSYIAWFIAGFGMGMSVNTCRVIAMQEALEGEDGKIAMAVNLSISIGMSVATGIGGALLTHAERSGGMLADGIEWIWMASLLSVGFYGIWLWLSSLPAKPRQLAEQSPSADS